MCAAETRRLRVAELLRRAVIQLLSRESLPSPQLYGKHFTVTKAQLSKDMTKVTIYVVPFMNAAETPQHADKMVQALRESQGWLRYRLKNYVSLRRMPMLIFEYDSQFDMLPTQGVKDTGRTQQQ